jgi:hypothetical protein
MPNIFLSYHYLMIGGGRRRDRVCTVRVVHAVFSQFIMGEVRTVHTTN